MYQRIINISKYLEKNSYFLFGARATGKSTLIHETMPAAQVIDLLHAKTFAVLLRNPSALEEIIVDPRRLVVIDEIQKLPQLLDEVQRLMTKYRTKFLLTGSSARKLKHGGANLLAGRAREARLFPLVYPEITDFSLSRFLSHGGLPLVYTSDEPDEELAAYVDTYLREEIKAEAVTRNVSAFSEFLDIMARSNGQELNYEGFAADLQVSPGTLKNYVQILEDTLLGFRLPGFTETRKRKATSRAKHYLFDLGVTRYLAKMGVINPGSKAFGDAFEHFIILEIRAFLSYNRLHVPICYWRSTSQFEVDVLLGNEIALEIKSTQNPTAKHLKGLRALAEEGIFTRFILVCETDLERKTEDGIEIVGWETFLKRLWAGQYLSVAKKRSEPT